MASTNIGIFVREQDAVQAHKILHLIEQELIAHEQRVDHHTNSDWSHQDEYSKTFLSSDGAVSEKIIKKH